MAHNRTDDTSRFMNAIAAFSAAPEEITVYGRLIGTQSVSFLDAILAEINETVLRRVLHFTTPDAVSLSVDVSERRVHRLHALPCALREKYDYLLGRNLTVQDAAAIVEIAQALAQTGSALYVRASLPDKTDALGFDGLSVGDVLAAKENATNASDVPVQFGNAISQAQKYAQSLSVQSGKTSLVRLGDAASCDALEEVSNAQAEDGATKPFVRLWQGGLVAEHALLIAMMDGFSVAMFLPAEHVQEQFTLLHRSVLQATGPVER